MAERELTVPRAGTVRAEPGFRVGAAMNPFDNVGTARLSGAITDRLCRVRMGYQPEGEERDIVSQRTSSPDTGSSGSPSARRASPVNIRICAWGPPCVPP
jgi:MoxR-like ATPase